MGKGKFFNGRVKKDHSALIKIGIISAAVILLIIFFVLISAGKKNKTPVLNLKESIDVEINGKMPEVSDFFNEIQNYDEDNIKVGEFDITKLGKYDVEILIGETNKETVTVNVVDTTPPELKLKDVDIKSGESYKIEDFVESCSDNSKEDCIVEFFTDSVDEDGNKIDYSKFTEDDKYLIKIVAKDLSENTTTPQEVYLTIGEVTDTQTPSEDPDPIIEEPSVEPTKCTYGDLTVDSTLYNFPIAVIVGDQNANCAINRDLWDSESIQNTLNNFYNTDYQRLKKQLDPILKKEFPYGANIVAYPTYNAVLNESAKGLVGYGIYVTVYMSDKRTEEKVDQQKNLKLAYYINGNSIREYDTNVYNIEK